MADTNKLTGEPLPSLPQPQAGKMSSDRDPLINRSVDEEPQGVFETIIRPCAAEFIGVMLFVFIGTSAAVAGASIGVTGIALAHGLAIALLVTATGAISGGHLNPAVTLGVFLAGAIPPLQAVFYFVSQIVGGILGAALTLGIQSETVYKLGSGGVTVPGTATAGEGFLCEMLLTSLLVTTVLLCAVDSYTKSGIAPLAIGFAVAVCILAGGGVSGASMNPARSFGPAVVASKYFSSQWDYHWIYWVGTSAGAALAAAWYRLFLAGSEKRLLMSG